MKWCQINHSLSGYFLDTVQSAKDALDCHIKKPNRNKLYGSIFMTAGLWSKIFRKGRKSGRKNEGDPLHSFKNATASLLQRHCIIQEKGKEKRQVSEFGTIYRLGITALQDDFMKKIRPCMEKQAFKCLLILFWAIHQLQRESMDQGNAC